MELYEVIILCAFNLISFIVGAKIGQSSSKGRNIVLNPVKAIKEDIEESKHEKKESLKRKKIDTMLQNIDNYTGSGLGQKEIPKE